MCDRLASLGDRTSRLGKHLIGYAGGLLLFVHLHLQTRDFLPQIVDLNPVEDVESDQHQKEQNQESLHFFVLLPRFSANALARCSTERSRRFMASMTLERMPGLAMR